MQPPPIHFLLVPDADAARRVRRHLATRHARSGVIVGMLDQLWESAASRYFVAAEGAVADDQFVEALGSLEDAFWSKSFEVAPTETADAIKSALRNLVAASDPYRLLRLQDHTAQATRFHKRVQDLLRLRRALNGRLPGKLDLVRRLLRARAPAAATRILVYHVRGLPSTARWHGALIRKLNLDADGAHDAALQRELEACLHAPPRAPARTALHALQTQLFSDNAKSQAIADASTQWIRVRDYYQEAEVAAGMAQQLLSAHPDWTPADIGILLPDSPEYALAVRDAFGRAGFALSGLPGVNQSRDVGAELVFHFLYCRQPFSPAMAKAAVLTSPLMTKSLEAGAFMAQQIMDGENLAKVTEKMDPLTQELAALLEGKDVKHASLGTALDSLDALLDGLHSNGLPQHLLKHRTHAHRTVEEVKRELESMQELDWALLQRVAAPSPDAVGREDSPVHTLEGITIWRETHEPWRDVRHLLALGFDESRYPKAAGTSSVFFEEELLAIRRLHRLAMPTPSERIARARERLRRQLGAVHDAVTFFVPYRNPIGDPAGQSESLAFMQRLITGPRDAELVVDLDNTDTRHRIQYLATADATKPSPPRVLTPAAPRIELGRNLLYRFDDPRTLRRESPSSLERMLVSPLAWLLHRLNALPQEWEPESVGPLLAGSLVHSVLQDLVDEEFLHRSPDELASDVKRILEQAARKQGQHLLGPLWRIERLNLTKQLVDAVQEWQKILIALRAHSFKSEYTLRSPPGTFWEGIPVGGRADVIFDVGRGQRFVVDYKWTKSSRRLEQMKQGYELQASIYRALARMHFGDSTQRTHIAYFTMRDQEYLTDAPAPSAKGIPNWHALEDDVSAQATLHVRGHLDALRTGTVPLNTDADRTLFEKRSISLFALNASPLIELFAFKNGDG